MAYNFKNMPELSWSWGYEYGLLLIVISSGVADFVVQVARMVSRATQFFPTLLLTIINVPKTLPGR